MSRGFRDIDAPAAGAYRSNPRLNHSSRSAGELLGTRSTPSGTMVRTMYTGDSEDCAVLSRDAPATFMMGGMPKVGPKHRQVGCIPGYGGHIAGKVAENIHGGTFNSENERSMKGLPVRDLRRTLSAPDHMATHQLSRSQLDSKSLRVPSRVPGYAGQIPGKMSETVHGCTFAEANATAQGLRKYNPLVTCEGWIHGARWPVDRKATYKFAGKMSQADLMPHFTTEEETSMLESNRKLGHTFGLKPGAETKYHPGDRYMQSFDPPAKKKKSRVNPDLLGPAGAETHDPKMDAQRWRVHNTISLKNGNQRSAY
mmetsp:Transcript_29367/g.51450  ORF Transcript_29367/g.51450 Transcript_29367/m.51450 type:complete len:312 (+) Transcript_29367:110-1045(+)